MKVILPLFLLSLVSSKIIFKHSFLQQEAEQAAEAATNADLEVSSTSNDSSTESEEIVSEPSSPDNDPLITRYVKVADKIYYEDYIVPNLSTESSSSSNSTQSSA